MTFFLQLKEKKLMEIDLFQKPLKKNQAYQLLIELIKNIPRLNKSKLKILSTF